MFRSTLAFALFASIALLQVSSVHGSVSCTCSGCPAGQCTAGQGACNSNGGNWDCIGDGTSGVCSGIYSSDGCSSAQSLCTQYCITDGGCASGVCSTDSSSTCFPSHATVELEDGSIKTMAALATGDRVLVGDNVYSDVYMFSHSDADAQTQFVQIATADNHTLLLTPSHYLYINGKLATAKTTRVGDMVVAADGKQVAVTGISSVRSSGLYNPHTMQGDVVVNGIKTSTYTDAIAPALAHAALWPVRMAYMLGQDIVGGAFAQGSELIANALPNGKEAY